jgi:hypothetical protein
MAELWSNPMKKLGILLQKKIRFLLFVEGFVPILAK